MKTKNIVLVLIGILLYMTDADAQTRFYDTSRTFNEQGFTYVANVIGDGIAGGIVRLNNRDTRWIGRDQTNRDGTPRGFGRTVEENNSVQMQQLARTIIQNAFTPAERQRLGGYSMEVILFMNPDTGVVDDVQFVFGITSGFATIPVTTYRRIELELKNRLRFVPTAEGRRRLFLTLAIWDVVVN